MRNLSLKGLETEISLRNSNLIKNAYFDANIPTWQLNGGVNPAPPMSILSADVTLQASSYPYTLTYPLLVDGGKPPYTWSILAHTPDAGKTEIPSKSITGPTLFGSFAGAASAQVLIRVTDSNSSLINKVINITIS